VEVYGSPSPVISEKTENKPDKTADKPVVAAKKPAVKKQPKKELEITPRDSLFRVTRDTMALLRDSIYWLEVRNMPLQPEEVISYLHKDSLKVVADSISKTDSLQNRTLTKWLSHLAFGEEMRFGKKYTFKYDGILGACPEYNFTDGFWLGQKVRFGVNFTENKSLTISPSVYYLTARKDMNWQVKSNFNYAPMRFGKLSASAGDITADFAGDKGLNHTINAVASLIFAENVAKFYRKQFATVSHQIELANALQLTAEVNYEKRSALENNTSYSFFGGRPASNLPHGQIEPMPEHSSLTAGIQLNYTPLYYYRIRKGRKYYDHSDFPHFMLAYNRTIPEGEKEKSSFDKIEASINQQINLNRFNRFFYGVNAGMFLSSKTVYLPDYKHFNTNELFVTNNPLTVSFSLLENYRYATNDKWLQVHTAFSSDYLLLKNFRFMQSYLYDESLHLRTLWLPQWNYTEVGYSIGFSEAGRVGVFAGFENGKYNAAGFTVSIPVFQWISSGE
jgi:hypothetical protein